jgi:hypothetical protein
MVIAVIRGVTLKVIGPDLVALLLYLHRAEYE